MTQPPPSTRQRTLLTHGAAILLGCAGGMVLLDGSGDRHLPEVNSVPISSRSTMAEVSSGWVDRSLRATREETAKAEAHAAEDEKPVTIPELLKRSRESAEAERKEYEAQVDEMIRKSARYANTTDFLAAIRRSIHDMNSDENPAVIFQAWLDKDPDAALAELGRNWRLSVDSDIAMLLERKLGLAWVKQQVEDVNTPIRLRKNLAYCLTRSLAWEGGLPALLQLYNAIPDPELKSGLVYVFSDSWPLDDPLATGQLLATAPLEMREGLMDCLAPPAPITASSFPVSWSSTPPTYANREWFKLVQAVIHPDSAAENDAPAPAAIPPTENLSLAEAVKAGVAAGSDRDQVAATELAQRVSNAMGEDSDLEELYSEGEITRSELLLELVKRIPGAEAFPNVLERQAWKATFNSADAAESARWAAELLKKGTDPQFVKNAWDGSPRDPRIPERLSRYQEFCEKVTDDEVLEKVREMQWSGWGGWCAITPAAAGAWLDSLPEGSSLRKTIRGREDAERKRRENR